jgi:hypothetical protein
MTVLILWTGSDIHVLEKLSRTFSGMSGMPVRGMEIWFWI